MASEAKGLIVETSQPRPRLFAMLRSTLLFASDNLGGRHVKILWNQNQRELAVDFILFCS